jgi:xylulokinase
LERGFTVDTSIKTEKESYYIGVDLGTTHIKAAVFDPDGSLLELRKTSTPIETDGYGQIYDPFIFYGIVIDQLSLLLNRYPNTKGISITGMSEAGLIINRTTGKEETPILPWFDRRTVSLADRVKEEREADNFYKTGLHNSFKYGIYKYLWLLNSKNIRTEDTIWLSVCDYIGWKLTGVFASDPSFAARTYVYDIGNREWDTKRLGEYNLTENNFPKVYPSGKRIGSLSDPVLNSKLHKGSVMVCIGGHDHACAAYAVLNEDKNRICNSVGTAETYLGMDEHFSMSEARYHSGMVYGPFLNGKDYFWMANISSSGQSMEWFYKKVLNTEADYQRMNAAITSMPKEPTGILYYPYLSGIGTPFYRSDVGGGFFGLRETHGTKEILKAILEGVNYQGKWILSLVPDIEPARLKDVICVGGAANSAPWMQIKANILGIPVTVPKVSEATLLGAVAVMLEKNYGMEEKQKFLSGSHKCIQTYEVEHAISKKYKDIYANKYTFLIDRILK